jgi:hypothetical protein
MINHSMVQTNIDDNTASLNYALEDSNNLLLLGYIMNPWRNNIVSNIAPLNYVLKDNDQCATFLRYRHSTNEITTFYCN